MKSLFALAILLFASPMSARAEYNCPEGSNYSPVTERCMYAPYNPELSYICINTNRYTYWRDYQHQNLGVVTDSICHVIDKRYYIYPYNAKYEIDPRDFTYKEDTGNFFQNVKGVMTLLERPRQNDSKSAKTVTTGMVINVVTGSQNYYGSGSK